MNNINRKGWSTLIVAAALISGCAGKGKIEMPAPVKVKVLEISESISGGSRVYSGTVEALNSTSLSLASGGRLKQVCVSEGQMVKKGDLIAVVDGTLQGNAAVAGKAQMQQAEDALEQAQDYYKRMKLLHDNGSLADMRWIDAQTKLKQAQQGVRAARASANISNKQYGDTRLYAPFSGYISEKLGETGQMAGPGVPTAILMNISQIKVKITDTESDIISIKKGMKVSISAVAVGNQAFTGSVMEIGVNADPSTRSYDVRALVNNQDHKLLPGMLCSVTVQNTDGEQYGIILPADIVQIDSDNRPFVWADKGGKARKIFITIGDNTASGVYVTGGLSVKEKVIIEGQQKISSGMNITE